MKFEIKYPQAKTTDSFEFEYSFVTKDVKLGQCHNCGKMTRWLDTKLQHHVCSEECGGQLWKNVNDHIKMERVEEYQNEIKGELKQAFLADNRWKDIIIVVRDQLDYFKQCINSIREHTHNYTLYIWDNGSGEPTKKYIESLQSEWLALNNPDWNIEVWSSHLNTGFIEPNNKLAEVGDGDYIILLNSDTKVFENWDTAMLALLQLNPNIAQVGYWGGHLDAEGRGFGGDNGSEIDYIPGWCFCIERSTFDDFGLFNKQLKFAYSEDADLSLRLKEAGKEIYALFTPLVYHYQNKTINVVHQEGEVDVAATFEHNQKYIQRRWKDYLANHRILLKKGTQSD